MRKAAAPKKKTLRLTTDKDAPPPLPEASQDQLNTYNNARIRVLLASSQLLTDLPDLSAAGDGAQQPVPLQMLASPGWLRGQLISLRSHADLVTQAYSDLCRVLEEIEKDQATK